MVDFDTRDGAQSFSRVYANMLSEGIRRGKYFLIDAPSTGPIILSSSAAGSVAPTAGAAQVDTMYIPGSLGPAVEIYQTTAQTALPYMVADKGLEIGGDQVNNESVEYVPGGNSANNPLGYTAGSDPGVFLRATLEIADVSGSDQLLVGFRKQEAYLVPTSFISGGDPDYNDFYGIGFSGSANPNDVKTVNALNGDATANVADTGFDWADTEVHKLEVRIKGRAVTCFINGVELGGSVSKDALGNAITAQPTTRPAAFSFDSGDFLIPFMFFRYDATTPGSIILRRLECGQLLEVGLQPEGRGPQSTR